MTLRIATPADVPALVRVINRAYLVEATIFHGERTDSADVSARLARPGACFLVIGETETGAGPHALAGAVFVETRGERGYFGMLSVDPDRQGRGLGRQLVLAAEAHCRAAGCRSLDIDVVDLRNELPGFYAALGFTVVGEAPFPEPSKMRQPAKLIVMSKSLADAPHLARSGDSVRHAR